MMDQFQADLITIYKNVMREVEGDSANFTELAEVLKRNGIELDDDYWPIENEEQ